MLQDISSRSIPRQMVLTLDENANVADIRKAMQLIRGVRSVSMVRRTMSGTKETLTPALKRKISKAHKDSVEGKTLSFATARDAQSWLESL